jgi:hypothetical protein
MAKPKPSDGKQFYLDLYKGTLSMRKNYRTKEAAKQWLAETLDQLEQVHQEMKALSDATKAVEGKQFYVDMYRREAKLGIVSMSVRWRLLKGFKHSTWRTLGPQVVMLPRSMREWYVEANREICILNLQEQALRFTLNCASKAMALLDNDKP